MSKNYLSAYENIKFQTQQLFGGQILPDFLWQARLGVESYNSCFHILENYLHQHRSDPGMLGIKCARLEQDLLFTQEMTGVTPQYLNYLDYMDYVYQT